jgi:two-component system NtrC family sensor kinase
LKIQVEERTAQLTQANAQLKQDILERQRVEAALRQSEAQLKKQATKLKLALEELHSYQTQLIQKEKMSSLGQLVAGVAHEINNPINFVYGNIATLVNISRTSCNCWNFTTSTIPSQYRNPASSKEIDLDFVRN